MGEPLALDGGRPTHPGPWPSWPRVTPEAEAAVLEVLRAGTWCSAAQGAEVVRQAEREFAALHSPGSAAPGSPAADGEGELDAVAVTSGTTALMLALQAAGVQAGDEVLVPPYTFIATASAAVFLGAVPVFVDVEPGTLNLDPEAVERAWTPRARAVVAVHLGGCPADLGGLARVCREHGLALIEDACQAPGAAWGGRPVGSWGSFGCFSFQESKNISAGEGGMVTGRGQPLAVVRSLHNVGRVPAGGWYQHERVGYNFRLTGLQAALVRAQLPRYPDAMRQRAAAAARLTALLRDVPGIQPLTVPAEASAHAWHLYIFRYDPGCFGGRSRAEFCRAMAAEGIPVSSGYRPLHQNRALMEAAAAGARRVGREPDAPRPLPVAEEAGQHCCWLGQTVLLAEEADLVQLASAMRRIQRAWG